MRSLRSIAGIARRKLKQALAPREAVKVMQGGYRLILHPRGDRHEMALYMKGNYEPATLALFDQVLRPGDVTVDVGANLGLMTLHAAKAVGPMGRIVSIEAHPATFQRLLRNIRENGLRNVTMLNVAAGAVEEKRQIFDVPSFSIGRASLIRPAEAHSVGGDTTVKRLDRILADAGAEAPRLVKIDVEGFEAEVIKGADETLKALPIICMELVTSIPGEGGEDPLLAHDLVMQTGLFDCYRFAKTKFRASPLVRVADRGELAEFHDNLIYIAPSIRETLPASIFA